MKGISIHIVFCLLLFGSTSVQAQKDPTLFTVDKTEVKLSEFQYIYNKTNGKKASYSKSSLDEYLDLYKKFKLKVAAAKEMKLDTISQLNQELDGYRRQLADSYLTDREVTEKLTKEAYERSQYDLAMSHILVKVASDANPKDSLIAYKKALDLMSKINAGENFGLVAEKFSDDKGTAERGGSLGHMVAPFPNGFYALETAAYNSKVKEIVGPIRTKLGYHIIRVFERRAARGEMEAGHILIRVGDKFASEEVGKAKADSLYNVLKKGGDFKSLAKSYSQDKATAIKDGYIGFFGVNRFQKSFEDAAFAIPEDNAISEPVRSVVGYHIIKRFSKRAQEEYKIAKRRLQPKVKKDARFNMAKKAMISRIKEEGGFAENRTNLSAWLGSLDEQFLTFKWKPNPSAAGSELMKFGNDLSFSTKDFENYCQKNSRTRIRKAGNEKPAAVALELYKGFTDDACIKYEESQLEEKYPEFKALMREYEEGILLFEATKINVWDKASQDSVGLKTFHEKNRGDYMWKQRAKVDVLTIKPEGKKLMSKINKFARNKTAQEIASKFNKGGNTYIAVTEEIIEQGKDELLDATDWTVGSNSEIRMDKKSKNLSFMQIKEIIAPSPKSLSDARGYIIADYQDQLEKEWIDNLRSRFKIKVNQKVLDKLVK